MNAIPRIDAPNGGTPRPPRPTVTYREGWQELIPAELRIRPQWVVWRYEWAGTKWTKVPYDAKRPGRKASSTNGLTWSCFEDALKCFEARRGARDPIDGVGYVFSGDDEYTGIDLDHCLGDDGSVLDWAEPYLARFRAGYGEVSPSGRGIKIIVRGVLPGKGSKKTGLGPNGAAVEMYDRGRFFTITGDAVEGTPDVIPDLGDAIAATHRQLFPPKAERPKPAAKAPTGVIRPDDEALLAKARSAKNGAKFCELFDAGDLSGHDGDRSRADFALCGMLAFWWNGDAAAVDRMFRRSALMRAKWNESAGAMTYGQLTVSKVVEGRTEFYTPPSPSPKSKASGGEGKGDGEPPEGGETTATSDDRPEIEINTDRHRVVEETIAALARDPDLYSRGDLLVQVVVEERDAVSLTAKTDLVNVVGTPRIVGLSDAVVGCKLTANALFFQWKKDKNGEDRAVLAHPPDWLIKAAATLKCWPGIRKLSSVVECPYPRPDGSLVEVPGYDPVTKTLYIPSTTFPTVPESPTRGDAVAAWGRIAAVIQEFPFASDDDRAVFLAGLLTVLARPAIAGPVPGIAVIGNKAGCGKGLLIDAIGLMAHGRIVPTSSYPGDKDEAAKVKVSIARGAFTIIHFDNVEEGTSYGNSALDSSITSMTVNDRVLGSSEHTGELALRPAWFLSGNNLSPGKDAHRRWLPCNLVTDLERPEERTDLKVKNLKAYVLERRGELVCDALTILRAHAMAGRPVGDWGPLGSFEDWDQVIRGAVWFATGRDCTATRRKAADDSPARQAKLALLIGWSELPDGMHHGLTATKAVEMVEREPERFATLHNALMYFGRDGKLAKGKAVGYLLRGMRGNLMEGMKFVEAGEEHKTTLWRVSKVTPIIPIVPNQGGDGGHGGDQAADLMRSFDSHNYASVYVYDEKIYRGSADLSPPSPSSPPAADEVEERL